MNNWTILCDFDGTISVEDVFDSLLDHFGRAGWQRLERDWRDGRIGSRACMAGQVELLHMRRAELEEHLDALWIDAAFPSFVTLARTLDVPLQVVSDGLDYAIGRMLRRAGVTGLPVFANQLRAPAAGQADGWGLDSPHQAAGCRAGVCKCALAGRAREDGRRVLLIGDGASDFCVSDRVDFVFAKNRLIEHCRALGIPYVPITGFDDAIKYLPALLSGELASANVAPAVARATV